MKIAVLIRGQLREWNNSKFSFFSSFEKIEKEHDVTYFFVTWDSSYFSVITEDITECKIFEQKQLTNIDIQGIHNDFSGKNLVLKILNYEKVSKLIGDLKLSEEYQYISYVRQVAGLLKQNYEIENDVSFDIVIETRPDVFILPYPNTMINPVEKNLHNIFNFVFYAASDFIPKENQDISDNLGNVSINTLFIDDLMFISNGLTSDIITGEFSYIFHNRNVYFLRMIFPHNMMCDYFMNFKLINKSNIVHFFWGVEILRPLKFFDGPVNLFNLSLDTLDKVKMANVKFKDFKEDIKNKA